MWRQFIDGDNIDGLRSCIQGNNLDIIDEYSSRTPLRQAAFLGSFKCAKWLIGNGADINAANSENWNALHLSLWRDHIEITKLLLRAGADVLALPNGYTNLIDMCVSRNARQCGMLLMDHGVIPGSCAERAIWVANFLSGRKRCLHVTILLLGIQKLRHPKVMGNNGRDAIRIIAKMNWMSRFSFHEWCDQNI